MNRINELSSDLNSVERMMSHLDKISIVAKIPNGGYGASIYDAAPNTEISVELDEDMAKSILEQCRSSLNKRIKEEVSKL